MPTSQTLELQNPPTGLPVLDGPESTFSLKRAELPGLEKGQVLLKTLFLSNDPAQRGWIAKGVDPARLYVPPVKVGEKMRATTVAEVVASESSEHRKGDLMLGSFGWTDLQIVDAGQAGTKIERVPGLEVTQFLGALGLTGLTAYHGINDVARAGKDDIVVVSGAAGATGSMVVQIAKHLLGCRQVIGLAGDEKKCRWVESLGANVCLNYKDADFAEKFIKATPDYVNVYFDNVGGEILDLLLTRMARHGRIAACGAITQYNQEKGDGIKNWTQIIFNRIEIKGLIVLDLLQAGRGPETIKLLTQAYKDGKIKLGAENETVVDTKFEDIPKTWASLFQGANTGKLVTKLV